MQVANWRIESLGRDSESQSDEEFFDCEGTFFCFVFCSPGSVSIFHAVRLLFRYNGFFFSQMELHGSFDD